MNDLSKVIYASQEYVNDLIKESGIIHKEGILVQEDCLADRGISVITELEPKQEGTGNPYPTGGGKNLFDKYNYTPLMLYINVDTKTYISYTDERVIVIPIKPNTTYTVKKSTTTVMRLATSESYPGNKVTFTNWTIFTENNGKGDGKLTITSGANDAYLAVQLFADADLSGSYGNIPANIDDLQVEEGSTATDYEPGSNVRPFIGYNTINITRSGKNLFNTHVFDKHDFKSAAITTKTITDNSITIIGVPTGGYCYIKNFKVIDCAGLAGKTLTVSATISGNEPRLGIQCYNKDDVKINDYFLLTTGSKTFTLPDDCAYLGYICYLNRGSFDQTTEYTATYSNIQLEVSETATDYESYKGETFTMPLGDTYYGGSINWNTGELIVDKIHMVLDNNQRWGRAGNEGAYRFYISAISGLLPAKAESIPHDTLICSHYPTIAYSGLMQSIMGIAVNHGGILGIFNPLYANYTVEQFKAELANNPITIAYGLANPIKIQLTSSFNIRSLEGTNILYSSPSLNNIIDFNRDSYAPSKVDVLLKTEQALTDTELAQVRSNLKFIGEDVEGKTFTVDGKDYTASPNAERFGDYENNIAIGQWSIAEGSGTVAVGRASHAEGAYSKAMADGSHVEGYQTKATGYWSHAEGEMTNVTSYASHAEGSYCTLPDGTKRYGTAAGYASHIEGGGCHATGSCSHAEGLATTVSGAQSHAEGRYTIAAGGAQHVEGIGNVEDAAGNYIHIAGNGSFEERSNAHTLAWDGTAWFSGDVYVGSTSGKNKDEGSQKLITSSDLRGAKLELEDYVNDELSHKGVIRKEGTIVQHDCNENMGISIASYFTPIQEGSGDPYPEGASKNKLNLPNIADKEYNGITWSCSNGIVYAKGTATAQSHTSVSSVKLYDTPNLSYGDYKVVGSTGNGIGVIAHVVEDGANKYYNSGQTFTINETKVLQKVYCQVPNGTTVDGSFAPMLVSASETDLTYVPYANIRPIVGHNNISITKNGKNQLPYPYPNAGQTVNGITYTVNTDGSIKVNGTPTDATKWSNFTPYPGNFSQPATMFFLPAGSYKLVCERANTSQIYPIIYERTGEDNAYQLIASLQNKSSVEFTTTKDSDKYYLLIGCRPGYAPSNETLKTIIVSANETDYTYETYKGETFTMALGSTYYGGSVNWNTGEFIIDKAYVLFTGLEDINLHVNYNNTGTNRFNYPDTPPADMNGIGLCSHMTYGVAPIGSNEINNRISGWKNGGLYWRFDSCTTKEEMIAYMEEQYNAGTPVQIVYTLAEPIKVQLNSGTWSLRGIYEQAKKNNPFACFEILQVSCVDDAGCCSALAH